MDPRTVGIIGGGQLGRMMAEAGHRIGVRTAILDVGGKSSPAGQVANIAIEGSCMFKDASEAKARELAAVSDVITIEVEHVDGNCVIVFYFVFECSLFESLILRSICLH